jgi:hypothetical protein
MADEEEGVLGNLPRSRPGQRSAKRANKPADPARVSRAAPERAKPGAARAKPAAGARRAAGAAAGEKRPPPRAEASSGGSPVSNVIRTVTSLAGGGARLAHGAARGVLRRLPRP